MKEQPQKSQTYDAKIINEIISRQARYQLKKYSREIKPSLPQFISIPYALLDNPYYRNGFFRKQRCLTYYWLRRYIVRAVSSIHPEMPDIFNLYWMQGELACCLSLNKISNDLKMPMSTIRGHITQLEKEGIIKVDWHETEKQEVYVLGTCHDGVEKWFIDQIFEEKFDEED
jgi:DNA-binding transcriptional ArsR family regulator